MSKKKDTAPNLPEAALDRARRQAGQQPTSTVTNGGKKQPVVANSQAAARRMTMEDLVHEYDYVLTDLRNMGLLAAALFAALVILSFLI